MAKRKVPQDGKPQRQETMHEETEYTFVQRGPMPKIPAIILSGPTVRRAGFYAGARIRIVVEHGRIVITMVPHEHTPKTLTC